MSHRHLRARRRLAAALLRLVAARLVWAGFVLLTLAAGCFALLDWAPGDFLAGMALDPSLSEETTRALRQRYGLDEGWWMRFARWLQGLGRGELGPSFAYGVDAAQLLLPRLRATLLLNLCALLVGIAVAAPAAWFAALRPAHWLSRAAAVLFQSALALPEIVVALALLALAVRSNTDLPGGAGNAFTDTPALWYEGLAIPCLALAIGAAPIFFRHIRTALSEALEEPFVLHARHAGLAQRMLLWRYVFPAAANPLVSLLGLWLGGLLSASLVVETITGWPGMGSLVLESVLARDRFVLSGAVLLSGASLLAGNLVADLLLLRLDPRIRP
jgi:peptide/nickel transport system permease protein